MKLTRKRLVVLLGAAVIFGGVATGTAIAVHTGPSYGGYEYQVGINTSSDPVTTISLVFAGLAGTPTSVFVPSGTTRLIDARFAGESYCFGGTAGNWCSLRIVVRNNATGITTELFPQSNIDFAFDSVGTANDYWEAHAIERSIRLGAGSYTVYVQWRTTNSSTVFRLDDWQFTVETHF